MSDLTYILLNGAWILGLALALSVISFTSYTRKVEGQRSKVQGHQNETLDIRPSTFDSPIRAIAERLVQTELLWLALMFCLFFFPALPGVLVLLSLPALWVARFAARGRFVPRTPFDWAILLMLLMLLVSTLTLHAVADPSQVTAILFGVGLYYAVVEWATSGPTDRRLRQAIKGYAVAGVALAVIALLGTDWVGNKFVVLRKVTRLLPSLVGDVSEADNGFNPNEIAGSLLWVLPLLLAMAGWLWASRTRTGSQEGPRAQLWQRVGFSLAAALCMVVFLLTQSRSAFIGLSFGLVLLLWLGIPRIRLLLASLFVAALAIGIFVGPQRIVGTVSSALAGRSVRSALDLQTLESRTVIWSHALAGIEDFPLTGIGVGAYRKVIPVLYPTNEPQLDSEIYHAHNILLQAALDGGLPGLAAYLSIWMVAAATFVKAWKSTSGRAKAGAAGIGAGLLAYFIYGFTDVVPLGFWFSLYFWTLLALLSALVYKPIAYKPQVVCLSVETVPIETVPVETVPVETILVGRSLG